MGLIWGLWIASFAFAGDQPFGLVLHGGAGTLTRENITKEVDAEYRRTLEYALNAGYEVLEKGGSAEQAVVTTIVMLEDSPLFNAGKGAVFANHGKHEFDASIMLGSGQAGACAGVRNLRNPILLAQAVMQKTPHVMLAGEGAEAFARELKLTFEDDAYFFTERRWNQLKKAKEKQRQQNPKDDWTKFGTVGVVALGQDGHLAAGTSTGGLTNKQFGRIGDSPIIGAGTYCDDATCGVSGTGQGEYFMRGVVAYDVAALMKYQGKDVQQSAAAVIAKLSERGGSGGLIAMDAQGRIAMEMNTAGMYRAYRMSDNRHAVLVYGDEKAGE